MPSVTSIVTLDEMRSHLRYPAADTMDDVSMQRFIDAATDVMRSECDDVIPTVYDEYYDGGDSAVWTWHRPIISVENVEEGWGWINWELDYVQVNSPPGYLSMFAYSLDSPGAGKITRRTAGNVLIPFMRGESNIRVVYTAGREKIPPVIKLATLELVAHWWSNSQLRSSSLSTSVSQYSADAIDTDFTRTTGETGFNQGVPYRILEMIKAYRRDPIIG